MRPKASVASLTTSKGPPHAIHQFDTGHLGTAFPGPRYRRWICASTPDFLSSELVRYRLVHFGNARPPVMAGTVDQATHRVGHHPLRRAGLEHRQCFFEFCRSCDPLSHILFSEDHRHPIMNRPHQFVRRGGDDGHGLDDLSLLSLPVVPDTGQGEDLSHSRPYEIGLLACPLAAPLVKPACGDDATTVAYSPPEGGLGLDPLGPGVDEQVPGLGFLGPWWHQSPAEDGPL